MTLYDCQTKLILIGMHSLLVQKDALLVIKQIEE